MIRAAANGYFENRFICWLFRLKKKKYRTSFQFFHLIIINNLIYTIIIQSVFFGAQCQKIGKNFDYCIAKLELMFFLLLLFVFFKILIQPKDNHFAYIKDY